MPRDNIFFSRMDNAESTIRSVITELEILVLPVVDGDAKANIVDVLANLRDRARTA